MKKIIISVVAILIIVIGAYMIGTGFQKETSAFVDDFSVSADNSVMTIHAGVSSSTGFIRKIVVSQNDDGNIKIDFISAFGGINGSIGAKDTFEIPLNEYATSISIHQGDNYRLILEKVIDTGEWITVGWIPRSAQ